MSVSKYSIVFSVLMLAGCAQTRVYQQSFDQVFNHLNRKYSVDLSSVGTYTICPTRTALVTNNAASEADRLIGQNFIMLLTSEDMTVQEFTPDRKLKYGLEGDFMGRTTRNFSLEATPDGKAKMTVDFFSHYLCFFSFERRSEREYLAELDRELSEGKIITGYSGRFFPAANLLIWSMVKEAEEKKNMTNESTVVESGGPDPTQ